jgi:hypothetical protein
MAGTGYFDLANAISDTIAIAERKKYTTARTGIISGSSVVSNGRSYALATAVDINPYDGRVVYFVLSKSGKAVVVGG